MKFIVITDAFPPMRTSAAVHMYELTLELIKMRHEVLVIIPTTSSKIPIRVESVNGFKLVSVMTLKTRGVGYIRRTFAEFLSPYILYSRLKSNSVLDQDYDGIIWYSPTIFWGPLISRLKIKFRCPAYLVLRDMFPDWAVDLGLMKKRLPYYFFKFIEFNQYKVANFIGIQAPGNFKYFNDGVLKQFKSKVELLWTWVSTADSSKTCSIDLNKTNLAGRKIFVYTGNMGVAQDFDLIMDLVNFYKNRLEVGFVFVGRGSEVERLKTMAKSNCLENILFYEEIEPAQIPPLYAQCNIGLVALDPRHKSNNIPGKFLSYMKHGLPVLARLNFGNDLVKIIDDNQVGTYYAGHNLAELESAANRLIEIVKNDIEISNRCKNLADKLFSTQNAVNQIINAIKRGY